MSAHMTLLLATTNRGKVAELTSLLADLPLEIVTLAQLFPNRAPVVEDGVTFEENALIKARSAAKDAMLLTLAEDAGLEVDALGGRPGVRSARFAKDGATDAENNAELLKQLQEIDDDQRAARFRCVMVLVDPWGEPESGAPSAPSSSPRFRPGASGLELVAEGRCEGMIARQARGGGGFGYDPLFVVNGFGRTMAELTEDEKNQVSHRARAFQALRPLLVDLVKKRLEGAARVLSR